MQAELAAIASLQQQLPALLQGQQQPHSAQGGEGVQRWGDDDEEVSRLVAELETASEEAAQARWVCGLWLPGGCGAGRAGLWVVGWATPWVGVWLWLAVVGCWRWLAGRH